ncbi:hypothetical protein P170DRAFT_394113 [Aspergillus steynii IBT 23096]|uniref:Zn(2)-C6 fungal-type domain-containing protein n=1 Tax=Aspergillus steynii IBT 23096 TaxID=1392250 RepID=A0A2I2FTN1_9EURO|nr:uncharacterized protein P170DRAFT_394113 [Aspergillus steynii IBT 23096]PLB43976.1 hypothetical protein P170DRAFT_394113 [Aspergillus steynii IBT 23096]
MQPSNSSTERSNPPPRRKSCEACKNAKRRCDLAFPACFRCARRNLTCVYPGNQPAVFQEPVLDILAMIEQSQDPPPVSSVGSQCLPEFNLSALSDLELRQCTMPDPVIDYSLPTSPDIYHTYHQSIVQTPRTESVILRTRSSTPISSVIAQRLQFSIDMLKDAPRMMVLENQTPWCHRQLYKDGMPRSMQDAFSCCAMYMARNEVNAPIILASFKTRIQDLLSSSPPTTPLEALAHTQALILYQIMRLFDGDIQARASAEPLISTLESSALSLLQYVHFPDPFEPEAIFPGSIEPVMEFWTSWVFQESARRTVLVTFYFTQIYRLLHDDPNMQCDGRLGLVHSWYFSAGLWHAQSAFDFAVAWTEKEHFVVYDANFTDVLQRARPTDVDLFGRMLLSAVLGIDEVRAWFYSRGAIL